MTPYDSPDAKPRDAGASPSPAAATGHEPVTHRQFLNLFVAVFLPMFMAAVDQTLLATATPSIAASLGGLTDTSWIAVGYLLASAAVVPLYGRFGDRRGRREMLLLAVGVFSLGSLACGVSQSLPQLIMARVLQGLGGAGLMTLSQALIGELVAPRERVRFQAYFAMVFTSASVVGPVVGGVVVAHFSWRWLFFANLPLAAFAVWRLLKLPRSEPHAGQAEVNDVFGIAFFAISTITGLYWLISAGHRFPWTSLTSVVLLSVALTTLGLLAWRELHHRAPFLPVDLLREKAIVLPLVTALVSTSCMFALVFFLPIYLQLGHHVGVMQSGLLMLPLTAGIVIGAQSAGRFISRTGRAKVVPVAGLALAAAALVALAVSAPGPTLLGVLSFLAGVGLGVVMPVTQVTVQVVAGRARLCAAMAMVSLFRSVGAASGAAFFGAVVYALMPSVDAAGLAHAAAAAPTGDVTHAFHVAFAAAACLSALGCFVATRVPVVALWEPRAGSGQRQNGER
jgi:EmrB/QacA subfamily drug resistance transporter